MFSSEHHVKLFLSLTNLPTALAYNMEKHICLSTLTTEQQCIGTVQCLGPVVAHAQIDLLYTDLALAPSVVIYTSSYLNHSNIMAS